MGVALLFVLRHDVWFWHAPQPVENLWGLPAGFLYHVLFCLVAAAWMAVLWRVAGPRVRDDATEESF